MYSCKVVQSGKSVCIRANVVVFRKVVVFGQKYLLSGKSGSIWENWLCLGKSIVFGQSGCVRAKVSVVIERGVRGQIFRTVKFSSLPDINLG